LDKFHIDIAAAIHQPVYHGSWSMRSGVIRKSPRFHRSAPMGSACFGRVLARRAGIRYLQPTKSSGNASRLRRRTRRATPANAYGGNPRSEGPEFLLSAGLLQR